MEIIAVEEHIVSRAINGATGGIISQTYPFYQTFLKPPANAPLSHEDRRRFACENAKALFHIN